MTGETKTEKRWFLNQSSSTLLVLFSVVHFGNRLWSSLGDDQYGDCGRSSAKEVLNLAAYEKLRFFRTAESLLFIVFTIVVVSQTSFSLMAGTNVSEVRALFLAEMKKRRS